MNVVQVLDKAQQDRVFQLLSEAESSTESSLASATRAGKSHQVYTCISTECMSKSEVRKNNTTQHNYQV